MHVGKTFPVTAVNQIRTGFPSDRTAPARCLAARFANSGQTGTVAIAWQGLTVVSDPAEYWSGDSRWTFYKLHHPTITAYTITQRIEFEQVPTTGSIAANNVFNIITEALDGITVVARNTIQFGAPAYFGGGQYALTVGASWGFQPFPALWFTNQMQIGWASWNQQPSYHPYRH